MYFLFISCKDNDSPPTVPGEDHESGSDSESSLDGEQDEAQEAAAKERKKAGLPEINLDALPSSQAMKMMSLNLFFWRETNLVGSGFPFCKMFFQNRAFTQGLASRSDPRTFKTFWIACPKSRARMA